MELGEQAGLRAFSIHHLVTVTDLLYEFKDGELALLKCLLSGRKLGHTEIKVRSPSQPKCFLVNGASTLVHVDVAHLEAGPLVGPRATTQALGDGARAT